MSEWYCHYCDGVVEPQHVTYSEHHDPRTGGCGNRVATKDEIRDKDKDAQIATLNAKLENVRWLVKETKLNINAEGIDFYLDAILREVGR